MSFSNFNDDDDPDFSALYTNDDDPLPAAIFNDTDGDDFDPIGLLDTPLFAEGGDDGDNNSSPPIQHNNFNDESARSHGGDDYNSYGSNSNHNSQRQKAYNSTPSTPPFQQPPNQFDNSGYPQQEFGGAMHQQNGISNQNNDYRGMPGENPYSNNNNNNNAMMAAAFAAQQQNLMQQQIQQREGRGPGPGGMQNNNGMNSSNMNTMNSMGGPMNGPMGAQMMGNLAAMQGAMQGNMMQGNNMNMNMNMNAMMMQKMQQQSGMGMQGMSGGVGGHMGLGMGSSNSMQGMTGQNSMGSGGQGQMGHGGMHPMGQGPGFNGMQQHMGPGGDMTNRNGSLNTAVSSLSVSTGGMNMTEGGQASMNSSMPNIQNQRGSAPGRGTRGASSVPASPNPISLSQMSASLQGRSSRNTGRTRGPTPKVDANGKVIPGSSADPGINEAMEKLCESMRRSAMSRNLVKQLSSKSVQRQGSSRSLPRSNSMPRKQLSGRSLSANLGIGDDGSGRGTPTRAVPIRRLSDAKHRLHQRAAGMHFSRQNSMGSQSSVASAPKTFLQLDDQSLGAL